MTTRLIGVLLFAASCSVPSQKSQTCEAQTQQFGEWLAKPTQPTRTWVDDELDEIERRQKSGRVDDGYVCFAQDLRELSRRDGGFHEASHYLHEADVQRLMREALPTAVEACDCSVDLDAARSAHWRLFVDSTEPKSSSADTPADS